MPAQCPKCESDNTTPIYKSDRWDGVGIFFTTLVMVLLIAAVYFLSFEAIAYLIDYLPLGVLAVIFTSFLLYSVISALIKWIRKDTKCNDCQAVFNNSAGSGKISYKLQPVVPAVKDVIFRNEPGYLNVIMKWLNEHPGGVIISWFQREHDELIKTDRAINAENCLLAGRVATLSLAEKPVLFAGHPPLRDMEISFCESREIKTMLVYAHLDMPILRRFGSESMQGLLDKMGMKEDEPLTHIMITKAIQNAQDNIAKTKGTDMHAQSEEEWMNLNMPGAVH